MSLVPSDPTQLDALFRIFCECAELNPEPIEGDLSLFDISFIIWGGTDDEAPIPSKEVLHWKPSKKNNKDKSNNLETDSSENAPRMNNSGDEVTRPKASLKGVSQSFE